MAGGRRPQAIAEEFGVVTLFHSVLGNVTAPSRFTFGTDYECISYWDPNPAGYRLAVVYLLPSVTTSVHGVQDPIERQVQFLRRSRSFSL